MCSDHSTPPSGTTSPEHRFGPLLFLDSAHPADWSRFLPLGIFRGVTTNPLLLERAGQPCTLDNLGFLADQAYSLGAKEIHLQVWGATINEMTSRGRELAALARDGLAVAVKVPATEMGFEVAGKLMESDCRVTMTAVYGVGQVLAAAGLGAVYAAPYFGRLIDAGRDGVATVVTMQKLLRGTGANTRLLVASLRTADQVAELAGLGLDTFTLGTQVASDLLQDELSKRAAALFQQAAENMEGKS